MVWHGAPSPEQLPATSPAAVPFAIAASRGCAFPGSRLLESRHPGGVGRSPVCCVGWNSSEHLCMSGGEWSCPGRARAPGLRGRAVIGAAVGKRQLPGREQSRCLGRPDVLRAAEVPLVTASLLWVTCMLLCLRMHCHRQPRRTGWSPRSWWPCSPSWWTGWVQFPARRLLPCDADPCTPHMGPTVQGWFRAPWLRGSYWAASLLRVPACMPRPHAPFSEVPSPGLKQEEAGGTRTSCPFSPSHRDGVPLLGAGLCSRSLPPSLTTCSMLGLRVCPVLRVGQGSMP